MSISLCMIVKNEERCILRCLESVKDVVEEMVIVDTGSTDNTVTLIQAFKDNHPKLKIKVLNVEWQDNFSAARNVSLDHATGQYILILDADEIIEPKYKHQLKNLKQYLKKSKDFYLINVKIMHKSGNQWDETIGTRIFPNHPELRFYRKIHEVLTYQRFPQRKFKDVNLKFFHDGYDEELINQMDKKKRNLNLLNEMIQKDPNDYISMFYFARDIFSVKPLESINLLRRIYPMINDPEWKKTCEYYLDRFSKEIEKLCLN